MGRGFGMGRGLGTIVFPAMLLVSASCAPAMPTAGTLPTVRALIYELPSKNLEGRLLATHNRERALFGAAPLLWDPNLAIAAASYGPALSALGRLQHSSRANRPGQAENLWMGTRGAYAPEAMVGAWNAEKRFLRPGIFPDVSVTGRWEDIAHFTQVIWKGTTHLGCAVHRDLHWEFLICRYSPKGNVDGRQIP